MEATYWHDKWKKNDIGFHEASGNSLLSEFFHSFACPKGIEFLFLSVEKPVISVGYFPRAIVLPGLN